MNALFLAKALFLAVPCLFAALMTLISVNGFVSLCRYPGEDADAKSDKYCNQWLGGGFAALMAWAASALLYHIMFEAA